MSLKYLTTYNPANLRIFHSVDCPHSSCSGFRDYLVSICECISYGVWPRHNRSWPQLDLLEYHVLSFLSRGWGKTRAREIVRWAQQKRKCL